MNLKKGGKRKLNWQGHEPISKKKKRGKGKKGARPQDTSSYRGQTIEKGCTNLRIRRRCRREAEKSTAGAGSRVSGTLVRNTEALTTAEHPKKGGIGVHLQKERCWNGDHLKA